MLVEYFKQRWFFSFFHALTKNSCTYVSRLIELLQYNLWFKTVYFFWNDTNFCHINFSRVRGLIETVGKFDILTAIRFHTPFDWHMRFPRLMRHFNRKHICKLLLHTRSQSARDFDCQIKENSLKCFDIFTNRDLNLHWNSNVQNQDLEFDLQLSSWIFILHKQSSFQSFNPPLHLLFIEVSLTLTFPTNFQNVLSGCNLYSNFFFHPVIHHFHNSVITF